MAILPRILPVSVALLGTSVLHAEDAPAKPDDAPQQEQGQRNLKDIVVTGVVPSPYTPPSVASITSLPAPLKEMPITVDTVSAEFIDDTSARRVRDLVGYVPGVNASDDSGATGDLLNIRGFDFIYQSYINGMRNLTSYNSSRRFNNIDRIEIFKGPGGVEFGAGDPGGFVNYVTKKPLTTQSTTIGGEAGNDDYFHGYVDTTGPLWRAADASGGDLGVFYRLIGSVDSANSFRYNFHTDGYQIAPSLLWKYAEDSSLLVEFEFNHRDQPYDRGIMYIEGVGFKDNFAPISTSYHEPTDYFNNDNTRTSVYWTHKLDEHVTFRLNAEIDTNRADGNAVRNPYTYLLYIPGTNQWNGDPTLLRTTQDFHQDLWSAQIKPEVLLNFDTGSVSHMGLLGFNYQHTTTDTASRDGFDLRAIDFLHPRYGLPPILLPPVDPSDPTSIPAFARDFRYEEERNEYGLYYQHKADITSSIHLLGGIRYDWYDLDSAVTRNIRANPPAPLQSIQDENLSLRFGGVVDLNKNFSLFAGWSDSFLPQSGVLASGKDPEALEAQAVEFGVKSSFMDDRLQSTLSFYQTKRKNLLEADPNDPTFTYVIPIGTVTVRGAEWSVNGKLTDDLNIQGGLAFMDTEITDTEDLTTYGKKFYNVPDFQAGLWMKYDTSKWLLKGLSVGVGAVYVGDREGDAINSFELPSYVRCDAGLYYQWRNWDFKLTCENLTNERYFLASQGAPDIIQPGSPRFFTFGTSVKF
ncbi:MAG: TonB-dependent receptor [Luteolibacter sp.]